MGIRFACPNGHPLHVKADLAGKRGICPECQVRFLIPQPAAAPVPEVVKTPAPAPVHPNPVQPNPVQPNPVQPNPVQPNPGAPQQVAPQQVAPQSEPATPTPAPPAPPVPAEAAQRAAPPPAPVAPPAATPPPAPHPSPVDSTPAEQPVWYVRPAAGGQFGPADDTLIHQWAEEGRLAADSQVWRTGWPDWRQASQVPEHFPQMAQVPAAPGPASEYNASTGKSGDSSPAAADVTLATARYKRRKLRSARGQQLAAGLLVCMAIGLAGVLVWVIRGASTSDESPARSTPAAAAEPAAEAQATPGEIANDAEGAADDENDADDTDPNENDPNEN